MTRRTTTGLALLCVALAVAQPAAAQQPPPFLYTCTVVDAVSIAPGGAIERDEATQRFARAQSPFTLDTSTGRMQRAAGIPAGVSETLFIVRPGSGIETLEMRDLNTSTAVFVRVDLAGPPWRFAWQGASSLISGLCERAPK